MAELFTRTIAEAARRLGSMRQAVSIDHVVHADGAAVGTRGIRVVNGAVDFEILPDRGLDIGRFRAGGAPIAWVSPTGFPALDADAADGRGWLRAFGGGLLTTCGLLNVGPACVDAGQAHPMHGRYSSLPADVVRAEVTDDEVVVEGVVREVSVFGAHLELRRRITSPIGSHTVSVRDRIRNRGATAVAPMVLYHLNFGWPLIDEGTTVTSPAVAVHPRDAAAEAGHDTWHTFPAPAPRYDEQVFAHALPSERVAEVVVAHPRGLSATVRFDTGELPGMFQWRVGEDGTYVLGIEPALVPTIHGRAHARDVGLLSPLAPGADLEMGVEIEVSGSLE